MADSTGNWVGDVSVGTSKDSENKEQKEYNISETLIGIITYKYSFNFWGVGSVWSQGCLVSSPIMCL